MSLRYPGGLITKSPTAPTTSAAKGVWTLEQALQYIKAGTWPLSALGDPYFQYNTLLLPGQGTNGAQNNTFLDSSTNNFTITRNGNTTQGTFTPFSQASGYWANYFDGSTSYLTTPSNSAFAFGTGDFTVEAWVYLTGTNYSEVFTTANGSFPTTAMRFMVTNSQKLQFYDGTNTAVSTATIATNTWTHVAVSRSGTSVKLFINGTQDGSTTSSNNLSNSTGYIGKTWDGTIFAGYISNLRVTKGGALYTSTFTPSTTPLTTTVSSGTVSLLTCQSNQFVDNSVNAFAITVSGSPSIQTFSPFPITTAYAAGTNGGSGYFDGSGDWLTAPSNAAFALGSAFTIEFWIYPITYGANAIFVRMGESSGDLQFGLNGGNLGLAASGVAWRLTGSAGPALNTWSHCVLVRSGTGSNQTSIFLNGTRIANGTVTDAWTTTVQAVIQATQGDTYLTKGYMSDIRVVKGTAIYDPTQSTLTVPTAPLTAISGTSLLLLGTNAGIIDNAEKNDLETVGNAQISTTQYKWGTSSMYFDGTGDYLTAPAQQNIAFGTGDFTIECWIYFNSVGNAQIASGSSGATTNAFYWQYYSSQLQFGAQGSAAITAASWTPSANTWYHVAVVRTASTIKQYVNGNLLSSASSSQSFVDAVLFVGFGGAGTLNGYVQDLRISKGLCRYPYNFTAPTAAFPLFYQAAATPTSDPYFENTTLLLPGNGTNGAQNNTFLDSSTNAFTITRNGNTTQGTFTPFSQTGWSNNLANKGNLTFTGTSAFSLDGDFTLECWVYLNSYVGSAYNELSLFNNRSGTSTGTQIDVGNSASGNPGNVVFWHNGSTILSASSGTVPLGQWTHLAFVRSGTGANNFKFYVNGVMTSQASSTATFFGSSGTFYIGQTIYDQPFNNTISNFRITKGGALYTSNFIPSTTPLTTTVASGTVSLLTCQSNRFVDNSASPVTLTPVTSPSVQAFSPFNPTASYSTSTVGGSGYFDGSGDYLTASSATAVGSGSFCFEAWIYPTNASAAQMILGNPTTGGMWIGLNIDGANRFGIGRVATAVDNFVSYTWTNNQWHHIAVNRNGTSLQFFVNGTQVGSTATNSINYSTAGRMIGGEGAGTSLFTGYISGWRFVDASTYTTTFTVPTAPPTAITNTSLLLNFTNGGITDATAKNDLETVGGASISTTQSKFGGSSIYLDGNGDYLKRPSSQFYVFNGDFTIEFWTWKSASGLNNYDTPVSCDSDGNATNGWALELGTVRYFYFTANAGGFTLGSSSFTVNDSAWHHYAITRYGSSVKMFRDGVQIASGTYSSAIGNSSIPELKVGAYGNASTNSYNGYINDLRITNGIARYTTNFTPPTSAFLTL